MLLEIVGPYNSTINWFPGQFTIFTKHYLTLNCSKRGIGNVESVEKCCTKCNSRGFILAVNYLIEERKCKCLQGEPDATLEIDEEVEGVMWKKCELWLVNVFPIFWQLFLSYFVFNKNKILMAKFVCKFSYLNNTLRLARLLQHSEWQNLSKYR